MNKLLLILIGFVPLLGWAQNKKTQVLVYGNGPDAYAAAVQAALSGVQTLWLTGTAAVGGELTEGNAVRKITSNDHLDAGLWAVFLQKLVKAPQATDSASVAAKRYINPRVAENVLNEIMDTVKNLTILRDVRVLAVKSAGKGWNATLSNRQRIKIAAVVDASLTAELYNLAGGSRSAAGQVPVKNAFSISGVRDMYSHNRLRTSVVAGSLKAKTLVMPLDALMPEGISNFFVTRHLAGTDSLYTGTVDDVPLLMAQAQAIGTAAAYCAFFKTTTDKIAIRTLQGELLAYGGRLIPFQDVRYEDVHALPIQRVAATGVLKGVHRLADGEEQYWFYPDTTVSAADIEPVVRQLYTRSQIWFSDNQRTDAMSLRDLLGLIKYTANRGSELDAEVEKGWERRFKFSGKYMPDHPVTRRQAAVLLDTYLKPFAVRVDRSGNFQY